MATLNINGTDIFYKVVGSGVPCLVMHGGLGFDHTYLHPWLDPLGDTLQLIYYDHRGNGQSGRPPLETLNHEQFAADADALREALGFRSLAVLGHSYGGFIALEYALRYPERLSHLILADTAPAFNYGDEITENARRQGATDEMIAVLNAPNSADDAEMKRAFSVIMPLYFHKYNAESAARVFQNSVISAAAAARNDALLPEFNLIARLGEIRAPALILVGRYDFITPPSQARIMHQHIPNSQLVVLEHSGHLPYIEESAAFFETIRKWIRASA